MMAPKGPKPSPCEQQGRRSRNQTNTRTNQPTTPEQMTPIDADRNAWTVSDLTEAAHIGTLSVEATNEDGHPYTYEFEIIATHATSTTPDRLAFGGITNSGFLESGFIEIEDGETLNNALNELHDDLRTYYFDGPRFTNRIIANNRM